MRYDPLGGRFRSLGCALAFLGAILFDGAPAAANVELRGALGEIAGELKTLLASENAESVAVGQFTGPPNLPTSTGPGFVRTLTEELTKRGVAVKARAKLGLKGEYRLTEIPSENADDARLGVKVLGLRVKVAVEDEFGRQLVNANFERVVRGEAAVTQALGLHVALPPAGVERDRDQALRKAVTEPAAAVRGSVVRTSDKSPYGIEILVDNKPAAPTLDDGLSFVKIDRGATYAVRLVNDSPLEAAVQLTVDGLSMFAFSELRQKDGPTKGQPLYSAVIVPAGKSLVVQGWHVTNEKTDRFLITEYAKSAAATLNHTANVGTITATFQAAWPENAPPPADEPGKRRGGTGDATGFGPRIDVKYEEVKRNTGVIRDTISVRYAK